MVKYGVKKFVFSSSATVYGPPQRLPVDEPHQVGVGITNPYGRTKYFIEEILRDLVIADPEWKVTLLRLVKSHCRRVLSSKILKMTLTYFLDISTLLELTKVDTSEKIQMDHQIILCHMLLKVNSKINGSTTSLSSNRKKS